MCGRAATSRSECQRVRGAHGVHQRRAQSSSSLWRLQCESTLLVAMIAGNAMTRICMEQGGGAHDPRREGDGEGLRGVHGDERMEHSDVDVTGLELLPGFRGGHGEERGEDGTGAPLSGRRR